ncbi:hypothetical protein ACXXDK_12160 [Deinococcus sp. PESE-38]
MRVTPVRRRAVTVRRVRLRLSCGSFISLRAPRRPPSLPPLRPAVLRTPAELTRVPAWATIRGLGRAGAARRNLASLSSCCVPGRKSSDSTEPPSSAALTVSRPCIRAGAPASAPLTCTFITSTSRHSAATDSTVMPLNTRSLSRPSSSKSSDTTNSASNSSRLTAPCSSNVPGSPLVLGSSGGGNAATSVPSVPARPCNSLTL